MGELPPRERLGARADLSELVLCAWAMFSWITPYPWWQDFSIAALVSAINFWMMSLWYTRRSAPEVQP